MDPAVQVAVIGVVSTVFATIGVIVAAYFNNKKERSGAAKEGIEETLRERIILRDEQIEDLKADIHKLELTIEQLKDQISQWEGRKNEE